MNMMWGHWYSKVCSKSPGCIQYFLQPPGVIPSDKTKVNIENGMFMNLEPILPVGIGSFKGANHTPANRVLGLRGRLGQKIVGNANTTVRTRILDFKLDPFNPRL